MRQTVLLLCVVGVLLASSETEAKDDAAKAAAVALLKLGNVHLDKGEFQKALVTFQQAYELFPSAKIFYSEAQTLHRLGRKAEALATFQRFLDEATDATAEHRAEARRQIAGLTEELKPKEADGSQTVEFERTNEKASEPANPLPGKEGEVAYRSRSAQPVADGEPPTPSGSEPTKPAPLSLRVSEKSTGSPSERSVAHDLQLGTLPTPPSPVAIQAVNSEAEKAPAANWLRTAGLVAAGVGAVGLVTGIILWEAAKSTNDDAVTQLQRDPSQARGTRNEAEKLATGANVCLIAGGMLAGVGAITTLISFTKSTGDDGSHKNVAFAPALGPNLAGIVAKGVW